MAHESQFDNIGHRPQLGTAAAEVTSQPPGPADFHNLSRSGTPGPLNLFPVQGVEAVAGGPIYADQPPLVPRSAAPGNDTGIRKVSQEPIVGGTDLVHPQTEQKREGKLISAGHPLSYLDDERTMLIAHGTCILTGEGLAGLPLPGFWVGPTLFAKLGAADPVSGERKKTGGVFLGAGMLNPLFPLGGVDAGYTLSNDPKLNGWGRQFTSMLGRVGGAYDTLISWEAR